jgi:hypothetical protein
MESASMVMRSKRPVAVSAQAMRPSPLSSVLGMFSSLEVKVLRPT